MRKILAIAAVSVSIFSVAVFNGWAEPAPTELKSPAQSVSRSDLSIFEQKDIGGLPYLGVRLGTAALYVPRLDRYAEKDFEAAYCVPIRHGQSIDKEVPLVQIERSVTDSLKVYAGLIQSTYKSKCQGNESRPVASPKPEVGVTVKKKYKVYLRPNEMGAGMNF